MKPAGLVAESGDPYRWVVTLVDRWLYQGRSPFQRIDIGEAGPWGRCLFLDGWLQLAEVDEAVYHEHLVFPALLAHPAPQRVLILGGGDGLAVREVLRHPAVQQVTLVDIDAQVVTACRQHLGDLQQGALDDPRVQVLIADARDYLRQPTPPGFDVILVDLVDFGPESLPLYAAIFDALPGALRPQGLVVGHAADPGPPFYTGLHLVAFMAQRFAATAWYTAFVTSFGEPWTFVLGGQTPLWADLSEAAWAERAARLTSPPRTLAPAALPGMLQHPPTLDAVAERLTRQPIRALNEPQWSARVLGAQAARRWLAELAAPQGEP